MRYSVDKLGLLRACRRAGGEEEGMGNAADGDTIKCGKWV
jgi:hypothetical protein